MDCSKVAKLLHEIADVIGTPSETTAAPADAPAPQKRGRGRPVKAEEPAAPAPAPAAADPFEAPAPTPVAPKHSLQDVRAALTGLKVATSQENALGVLKTAGGVANLSELPPAKYDAVVAAVEAATPKAGTPEVDPFEVPAAAPAAPEKSFSLEDVKAAVVAAQKRTATDTVQKVVMKHGGKAKNADTGAEGPSLKALPVSAYAACLAEINGLPGTK
jgi:hypothetical protein